MFDSGALPVDGEGLSGARDAAGLGETRGHGRHAGLQQAELRQIAAVQGKIRRLAPSETTLPMVWLVSTITVCAATLTSVCALESCKSTGKLTIWPMSMRMGDVKVRSLACSRSANIRQWADWRNGNAFVRGTDGPREPGLGL